MSSSCSDAPPANHRRRRRDHNVVAGLDTQHYIRGRSMAAARGHGGATLPCEPKRWPLIRGAQKYST